MQKYLSFGGRAGRKELWVAIAMILVVGGAGDVVGVQMHNYAIVGLFLLAVVWRTSRTTPSWSTAGQSQCFVPAIAMPPSLRCYLSPRRGLAAWSGWQGRRQRPGRRRRQRLID
jgi:hypothetical protein